MEINSKYQKVCLVGILKFHMLLKITKISANSMFENVNLVMASTRLFLDYLWKFNFACCSFDNPYLFQGVELNNLKTLRISDCKLSGGDMLSLSKAKLAQLAELNIGGFWGNSNKIGGKGTKYLLQGNWDRLEKLDLGGNEIGGQGIKAIVTAELTSLKRLYLYQSKLNYQAVEQLIKHFSVKRLSNLDFKFNEDLKFKENVKELIILVNSKCQLRILNSDL